MVAGTTKKKALFARIEWLRFRFFGFSLFQNPPSVFEKTGKVEFLKKCIANCLLKISLFSLFDTDLQSDYLVRSQLYHNWNMANVVNKNKFNPVNAELWKHTSIAIPFKSDTLRFLLRLAYMGGPYSSVTTLLTLSSKCTQTESDERILLLCLLFSLLLAWCSTCIHLFLLLLPLPWREKWILWQGLG